jgi:hypothetical protein
MGFGQFEKQNFAKNKKCKKKVSCIEVYFFFVLYLGRSSFYLHLFSMNAEEQTSALTQKIVQHTKTLFMAAFKKIAHSRKRISRACHPPTLRKPDPIHKIKTKRIVH